MASSRQSWRRKLRGRLTRWAERAGAAKGWYVDRALSLLEALAGLSGIGPECHALAGIVQAAAGRPDLAIPHYEAALNEGRSRDAGLHHRLGLARFRAGDPGGAESNLRRAMELAPDEHWPCGALGECLLTLNRPADAEWVFRKGLELNPDNRWFYHQLAFSLCRQGRAGEAIDELIEAAAAAEPGSGPLPVPLPWYLLSPSMATPPRAGALAAVVERHPQAAEALIFLALLETFQGKYEKASAGLRQAAALRWPDLPQPAGTAEEQGGGPKPPSFLIIGQAKAGTTALYTHLCSHPRFEPPLIKEPQFWSDHYASGRDWYRAHFPPLPEGSERITGEASTTYFFHPDAPRRIAEAMPEIKLILLLRKPVARAYSHYWMRVRQGQEFRAWEEVVDKELDATPTCPLDVEELDLLWRPHTYSYLFRSATLPHLQRWLSYFPPEQLLILRSSELAGDLPRTMCRVCAFLDLPPFVPPAAKRENEGYYPPMAPEIQQRLRTWFALHERVLEDFLANLSEKTL